MEVLTRERARLVLATMACLGGLLVGCAVLERLTGKDDALRFSHAVHVQQEELDCVICHEDALTADEPGMPWADTCLLCHDELDEDEPEERRVETLFVDDVFQASHHSALADEVTFSHLRHTSAGIECSACHTGIDSNDRLTGAIGVSMASCVECHEDEGQPNECATCHTEVDRDWMPPNHVFHWELRHGPASRECLANSSRDCTLCHAERNCIDCHLAEPPASHTNPFRRRTHGFHARLDRDSCAACHRPDSCQECHDEVRPMSHRGQWGATKNRHCFGCHLPLRANGCITCHEGTPSHLLATPMPGWHNPAMNCRQCHGISAPLPHVDKGDDCNACHQ